ncbi:hypothetical protein D9M71_598350 [compost metagenome]
MRLDVFGLGGIALRQNQAEHAALPGAAVDIDLASEQMRQVTGDRQPQASATITAIAGAIDLVEGAEDRLLLIGRNADAGVTDCEHDTAASLEADVHADLATLGELDGVGQQVLEDLLQALTVGEQRDRYLRLDLDLEGQPLVAGKRLEHAAQAFDQALDLGGLGPYFELAGLDLGDIENVVD